MKLNLIASALVLSSTMLTGNAMASDGTVHFLGEVVDSTCQVTPQTADQNVNLGKVNKTAFAGVGSTAAPTEFHIDLTGCPATYTKAAVRFDGTEASNSDGDLAIGNPANGDAPGDYTGDGAAITASGVAIRIYNRADNSQVKLYNDSAYSTIDTTAGTASMEFIARYIATDATVTAGTANADSQFTVEYQK
ncbi:fimbrial protein [Salmonella enterica]|uniref:Fimbrial protein n=2 Tax=Salmonella enterica I TaxID=59201 RepID=A0A5W2B4T9_SALET|nr:MULTISPECIES: chaperone-usher fimbrial major subunit [Salmonella]EAA0562590.1 fimbrial protein [Salmonella enterica subsp. enterica serovar Lexington]EAA7889774.1 fimbrial protein [Salmonella enterica]EAC1859176.1 fimbrial protein [Salmonella enterica subsp. enterica]EBL3749992.1 fimbrial protein [Salmonella enterica subsp. enterica serovar Typhimurium]EBM0682695.1 fimbrial protein [Salmonella enterica subsp. enterica serovar Enteritidis]EBS5436986.1 fimbrial protein [Salmonella enterica s